MPDQEIAPLKTHVQASSITTPFAPRSFAELIEFANIVSKTTLVPKDYIGEPGNIVVAVQMGAELGLAPLQSLQNIAVINGRPSVWGDALLALCRRSPLFESIEEKIEGEPKHIVKKMESLNENREPIEVEVKEIDISEMKATCLIKRRDDPFPIEATFTGKEAEDAGLLKKNTPWKTYPKRMLQMRARGFALRDAFPDLLKGLITADEAIDYPILEGVKVGNPITEKAVKAVEQSSEPKQLQGKSEPPSKPKKPLSETEQIQIMTDKIKSVDDVKRLDRLSNHWTDRLNQERQAGNPVSENVVSTVADQFNQAYERLTAPQKQKPSHNQTIEELP